MNINSITNKRIAVHCDNKRKIFAFLAECELAGIKWGDGTNPTDVRGVPLASGYFMIDSQLNVMTDDDIERTGFEVIEYTPETNFYALASVASKMVSSIKDTYRKIRHTTAECRRMTRPVQQPAVSAPAKLSIDDFAQEVYNVSVDHGWWDKEPGFCDILALCHSELSEALDEYRNDRPLCYYLDNDDDISTDMSAYKGQELHGIGIELADCILRILDYCAGKDIDIEMLLRLKNEYNKTRAYKHGGKKI